MAVHALAMDDEQYSEQRDHRLLGFLLFLISDCIIFSSFIFTYLYLRSAAPVWPPPGVKPADLYMAGVNSIVLFGSGATMHFAMESFKHDKHLRFYWWMMATIFPGHWKPPSRI